MTVFAINMAVDINSYYKVYIDQSKGYMYTLSNVFNIG